MWIFTRLADAANVGESSESNGLSEAVGRQLLWSVGR
jgi:hypothetical protein